METHLAERAWWWDLFLFDFEVGIGGSLLLLIWREDGSAPGLCEGVARSKIHVVVHD